LERFYTGPFEGPVTINPPALPEDIYNLAPSFPLSHKEAALSPELGRTKCKQETDRFHKKGVELRGYGKTSESIPQFYFRGISQ
jgi:hypothetical protein